MKERGLTYIPETTQTKTEQTATYNLQTKKTPEQHRGIPFEAAGYRFIPVENIPHIFGNNSNGRPDAVLHSYEGQEIGEGGKKLNVTIIEVGLNDPTRKDEPIPLRIDHGCPCMEVQLEGHDCAQQRELAMDAIRDIGRGMMVLVNTEASAGMGHGISTVMEHQKKFQLSKLSGEDGLTMMDHFRDKGITRFDVRQHPEVASLIARRLEAIDYDPEQNPIIFMGSSPAKIESLQNGHRIRIADTMRVIVADRGDRSKKQLGYGADEDVNSSGVYVEKMTPIGGTRLEPLTPSLFRHYKQEVLAPKQIQGIQQQKETVLISFSSIIKPIQGDIWNTNRGIQRAAA